MFNTNAGPSSGWNMPTLNAFHPPSFSVPTSFPPPLGGSTGFPQPSFPPPSSNPTNPGGFSAPAFSPPPSAPPPPGPPHSHASAGYAAPTMPQPNAFAPPLGPPSIHPAASSWTTPPPHRAPPIQSNNSGYFPPPPAKPYSNGGGPGQYPVDVRQPGLYPPAPQYGPSAPAFSAPHMPPSTLQTANTPNGQHRTNFRYSMCTGKRKALCIGINYTGQKGELRGCINDVNNVKKFLQSRYRYKPDQIVTLVDNAANPRSLPTRQNIIDAMRWLVKDAQPNDALFFHYSGHGGQTKDLDGDEADGYDEVIYPLDFKTAGFITDDLMHDLLVKPLPIGCRLTAIFDSCHSGSSLDLPYMYSTEGKLKEPNTAAQAGLDTLSIVTSYTRRDVKGMFRGVNSLVHTATGGNERAQEHARLTKTSPADVISWSGCKDSQTSADAVEAGRATGAMSYAFITSITVNPTQTYQQLLNSIRDILRAKYSQKPQLSCSHEMDTSILFIA